jgi:hypothetical protein
VLRGSDCGLAVRWYTDGDGDGFTDPEGILACEPPEGYGPGSDPGDCDDGDASVHPGAPDTPGDGVDQDCDGDDPGLDTGEPASDPSHPPGSQGCGCVVGGGGLAGGLLGILGWIGVAWRRR